MSSASRFLTPRLLNFWAFLLCTLSMVIALTLQYVMSLQPCPLCIFQRVTVIITGLIFLIAAIAGINALLRRFFSVLTLIGSLIGGALSIRHLWLQSLPADQVPSCGPGLNYMLDVFPLQRVVSMVLKGSGECATVHGHFLGLTIPGWTLILFAILLIVSLYQLFRRRTPA